MSQTTESPVPPLETLQTVAGVARHLAVSRSKVYAMMDAGELPFVKFGRSRRIRWSDVAVLIERSTISAESELNYCRLSAEHTCEEPTTSFPQNR
jgi:excisionase family DNA binding protein